MRRHTKHISTFIVVTLLFLFMAFLSSRVEAQNSSAQISNVRCEIASDQINYTFDVTVNNLPSTQIFMGAVPLYRWTKAPILFSGSASQASNYSFKDGTLVTGTQQNTRSDTSSTRWQNIQLSIPVSVFPPAVQGSYDFISGILVGANGVWIGGMVADSPDCIGTISTPQTTPMSSETGDPCWDQCMAITDIDLEVQCLSMCTGVTVPTTENNPSPSLCRSWQQSLKDFQRQLEDNSVPYTHSIVAEIGRQHLVDDINNSIDDLNLKLLQCNK